MQEILVAWALMQPIEGRKECVWIGVTNYYAWNMHGYGVKVSWWQNNEIHVAPGKNGVLFTQFRIW